MNQRRPIYFGMVHTRKSKDYTPFALDSFVNTVIGEKGDWFILIDNDKDIDFPSKSEKADVDFIVNSFPLSFAANVSPLSFAANVNQVMVEANKVKADIVFLNNDLIFTPNWLQPLLAGTDAIVSPLSNAQLPLHGYPSLMDLADLEGRKPDARHWIEKLQKAQEAFWVPFFAVRIPYEVYSVLGPLDERFGKAGAEDVDYCIRAWLAGFRCEYRNHSWILHFSGKSTWRGAETSEETKARDAKYREEFERKWGAMITRHALDRKSVGMPASMGYKEGIEYMIQSSGEEASRAGSSGAGERII